MHWNIEFLHSLHPRRLRDKRDQTTDLLNAIQIQRLIYPVTNAANPHKYRIFISILHKAFLPRCCTVAVQQRITNPKKKRRYPTFFIYVFARVAGGICSFLILQLALSMSFS
jgi:hypothetical protein